MGSFFTGQPLSLKVLGTNQGTSMDGIDTRTCPLHSQATPADPSAHGSYCIMARSHFPSKLKQKTMRVIKDNHTSPEEVSVLNIRLGKFVADALQHFASQEGFDLKQGR